MTAVLTATSTEVQNNFGRYLVATMEGQQVIVTRNGKRVARIIPEKDAVAFLTDSLTGILKTPTGVDEARSEALDAKYAPAD